MPRGNRVALIIVFVLGGVLPITYCAWASLETASHYGYAVRDMDWDGDGSVSPSEFFASSDIGVRPGQEAGCQEFFSLKDGSTIREVCRR